MIDLSHCDVTRTYAFSCSDCYLYLIAFSVMPLFHDDPEQFQAIADLASPMYCRARAVMETHRCRAQYCFGRVNFVHFAGEERDYWESRLLASLRQLAEAEVDRKYGENLIGEMVRLSQMDERRLYSGLGADAPPLPPIVRPTLPRMGEIHATEEPKRRKKKKRARLPWGLRSN